MYFSFSKLKQHCSVACVLLSVYMYQVKFNSFSSVFHACWGMSDPGYKEFLCSHIPRVQAVVTSNIK